MKNLDLMIKDRRHSCNPRAAIRLGEPGGLQPRLQIANFGRIGIISRG
jgi:hypothetical protein